MTEDLIRLASDPPRFPPASRLLHFLTSSIIRRISAYSARIRPTGCSCTAQFSRTASSRPPPPGRGMDAMVVVDHHCSGSEPIQTHAPHRRKPRWPIGANRGFGEPDVGPSNRRHLSPRQADRPISIGDQADALWTRVDGRRLGSPSGFATRMKRSEREKVSDVPGLADCSHVGPADRLPHRRT